MAFNTQAIVDDALKSMKSVLEDDFSVLSRVAPVQAALLLQNAMIIGDPENGLTDEDRAILSQVSARAARDVFTAYDAISVAAAEQAIAAAWEVVTKAVEAAI